MSDGFAPLNNIEWSGNIGIAYPTSADKMIVFFHKQAIQNPHKSEQAGRPIYDEFDHVRIQQPGERDYIDRKVTPADISRWPDKWEKYQKQATQGVNGTPIDLLFPKNPGIAANVRGAGFHTVEQLAEASSYGMSSLGMRGQDYVNAAQRYLEVARRGVDHHQMQQALDERDQKIRILENQNKELISRLSSLEDLIKNKQQSVQQAPQQTLQNPQYQVADQLQYQAAQQLDFGLPPPPISLPDLPPLAETPKKQRRKL